MRKVKSNPLSWRKNILDKYSPTCDNLTEREKDREIAALRYTLSCERKETERLKEALAEKDKEVERLNNALGYSFSLVACWKKAYKTEERLKGYEKGSKGKVIRLSAAFSQAIESVLSGENTDLDRAKKIIRKHNETLAVLNSEGLEK